MNIEESEEKRMNNSYKKDFTDEKGNSYTLEAEGEKINFHGKIYKLQHENTKCKKKEGIFTSDIGIHSLSLIHI